MTLTRSVAALHICLCLSVAACGASPESEDVGRARQGIVDGDSAGDLSGLVLVVNLSTYKNCSGFLIAPNLVVTSRQCVASFAAAPFDCATSAFGQITSAANVFLLAGPSVSVGAGSNPVGASEIRVPEGASMCGNDLALIIAKQSFASASPITPRFEPAMIGESYAAAGYGYSGGPAPATFTAKRRDDLSVSCLSAECGPNIAEGEWGGTSPTGPVQQPTDGGGPAIDAQGRAFAIGVRGSTAFDVYTSFAPHEELIVSAAAKAAQAGDYDLPAWAGGTAGDAGTGGGAGAGGVGGSAGAAGQGQPSSSSSDGGCQLGGRGRSERGLAWLGVAALALAARTRRAREE